MLMWRQISFEELEEVACECALLYKCDRKVRAAKNGKWDDVTDVGKKSITQNCKKKSLQKIYIKRRQNMLMETLKGAYGMGTREI
jgi:hypothetical protein